MDVLDRPLPHDVLIIGGGHAGLSAALTLYRALHRVVEFGYERRQSHSAGLLAIGSLASPVHALGLSDDGHKFTDDFTIYTHGDQALAAELSHAAEARGMRVESRKISRLVSTADRSAVTIEFEDGSRRDESFLVHRPATQLTSPLAEQLGLTIGPTGDIETKPPFHETSVRGVWAAGDCASMMKIVPNAVAMGAYAGAGIARSLPRRETGKTCVLGEEGYD